MVPLRVEIDRDLRRRGGGGGGFETRPGTEKRCSHNLQSNPLGSGFTKTRENFRDIPGCSGMFHVPGFIDGRSGDVRQR